MTEPVRTLRLRDVIAKTGMSRSRIYVAIAHQGFPRPIKLSANVSAWVESEIDAFLVARIAARDESVKANRPAARAHASVALAG